VADWYLLILIGEDRPGIVAEVSQALYAGGCNLGEASMMRLGGNFVIMVMVRHDGDLGTLESIVQPVATKLNLRVHVDPIHGRLHAQRVPDVRVTVFGADRTGIVAQVTAALARGGLDILDLESDVGGTAEQPLYIMHIEGIAQRGMMPLEQAIQEVRKSGVEGSVMPIDTVLG